MLSLPKKQYPFFSLDNSYICFNRRHLVSKRGLADGTQPRGKLKRPDLMGSFKILKKSLYAIRDFAADPFLRGTIIYEWKKELGLIKPLVP